jgi:hypothetical protein
MRQPRPGRRAGPGRRQNPGTDRSRNLLPPRPASPVHPGDAVGAKTTKPQIHRRPRHTSQRGNLLLLPTLSTPQHVRARVATAADTYGLFTTARSSARCSTVNSTRPANTKISYTNVK